MCSSFPVRTPKLQPTAGQPLIGECQIPTKKDTLCPRAKEKPPARWHVGQIVFRIKPHSHHRRSQGSNKNLCAPGDPTENEPDLPLSVWVSPEEVRVSSGLPQGQRLWVQQPWVWHKPSWRRLPWTPQRAARTHTGLGKQTLGGTNRTLCSGPRRKEQWPHRRLTQTCPECPGVSSGGSGQRWPAAGWGVLSMAVHARDLLKEVAILFITSTTVGSNNRERTQPCPSTENWIKDLLSMAPPIRTRPSFPLSQSLPLGSFHKLLNLIHHGADRMKTTITEN